MHDDGVSFSTTFSFAESNYCGIKHLKLVQRPGAKNSSWNGLVKFIRFTLAIVRLLGLFANSLLPRSLGLLYSCYAMRHTES